MNDISLLKLKMPVVTLLLPIVKSKRVVRSVANQMTSMMLGTFSNGSLVNAATQVILWQVRQVLFRLNLTDLTSDQWVIGYTLMWL
ncbi:MAG: hypothetical protein ACLTZB_02505 [Streptococcus salivarius]